MATYKVIQDIEAEDKLLGPLSFRQFIYFLIAAFLGFLNFTMLTRGLWPGVIVLGPPMLFCLFFAWPWSPDQPTEVWALAHIRYYFKPRKRLWNQSGVKEFVTVTVPRKIEKIYTDGLSQDQVHSRLEALSQTIDSRGWAVKNASAYNRRGAAQEDRLLGIEAAPMEVSDVYDEDDILDPRNNANARHMGEMINSSGTAHRQQAIDKMNLARQEAARKAQWFQPSTAARAMNPVVDVPPVDSIGKPALPSVPVQPVGQTIRVVTTPQPVVATDDTATPEPAQQATSDPTKTERDPAILNLARDNNLYISTMAREANRSQGELSSDGEVVVSLH